MRIPHKHEDEIGELANSFNSMANALQERDVKINEYNDYLKDANYQLERKQTMNSSGWRRKKRNLTP